MTDLKLKHPNFEKVKREVENDFLRKDNNQLLKDILQALNDLTEEVKKLKE